MIGKLTGTVERAAPGEALIDVAGVGYLVRIPLSLELSPGGRASLSIYTAVRDDAIDLYGFAGDKELLFFKQLMSVSGIGPKTALGIMSVSDVESLKRSIGAGDAAALTKVFGIGKKSAERIVVELREKVGGGMLAAGEGGEDGEVIEALLSLGYSASESRAALKKAGEAKGVKERLGRALRHLGSH